jgi:hypothetical protein
VLPENELRKRRAAIARAEMKRLKHPGDAADAEANALRSEYKAAKLAEAIKRVVDAAPPLSQEQRDRLAALLRSEAA